MSNETPNWQQTFLSAEKLQPGYLTFAQQWLDPVVTFLKSHPGEVDRPLLVGINGAQGSGKTTAGRYIATALQEQHQIRTLDFSLDDFYLSRQQREALAADIHPLLLTRGVPGTHDVDLLKQSLLKLRHAQSYPLRLPVFDKANDDRCEASRWREVSQPPQIVILEGWCLGCRPQTDAELTVPANKMEQVEDAELSWRRYVNNAIQNYLPVWDDIDFWIMLQAPSFDCVFDWRLEQEQKLAMSRRGKALLDEHALHRFLQHFQRITEASIKDLPHRVDYLLELDKGRNITAVHWPNRESS